MDCGHPFFRRASSLPATWGSPDWSPRTPGWGQRRCVGCEQRKHNKNIKPWIYVVLSRINDSSLYIYIYIIYSYIYIYIIIIIDSYCSIFLVDTG